MSQEPDHIRIAFYLSIDGYIEHPTGELAIHPESWEQLKKYHAGIGKDYISSNASGGSESTAQQILASRGARFVKIADHPNLTMLWTDDE